MFEHWPCFPEAQEMTSSARPADGPPTGGGATLSLADPC